MVLLALRSDVVVFGPGWWGQDVAGLIKDGHDWYSCGGKNTIFELNNIHVGIGVGHVVPLVLPHRCRIPEGWLGHRGGR